MQQSTTIQPRESEYVWWRRRGSPIAVRLRQPAMEALYREVMEGFNALPRRGMEVGGILLGVRNADSVTVEDFEPVISEHRLGPSYLLSDTDIEGLRESIDWFGSGSRANLSVVGFYRSHTRSEFSSTEDDEKLFAQHLPEGAGVFLLIKPLRQQTAVADFFFWEDGRLREASTPLHFPFEGVAEETPPEPSAPPAPLQLHPAAQPAPPAPATRKVGQAFLPIPNPVSAENTEQAEMPLPPDAALRARWFWAGSAAALAILGGLLGYVAAGASQPARAHVPSPTPRTAAAALAPDAERSRSAPPPQTATPAASQPDKPSPLGEPLPAPRQEKSHVRRRHHSRR